MSTIIEVEYSDSEQRWVATTVSDGVRIARCSHEDLNELLDEVSAWKRLFQAEVRIIRD